MNTALLPNLTSAQEAGRNDLANAMANTAYKLVAAEHHNVTGSVYFGGEFLRDVAPKSVSPTKFNLNVLSGGQSR